MSDKYYAWLDAMARRDLIVMQLVVLAISCIVAWIATDYMPPRLVKWLRPLYVAGGVVLIFVTIWGAAYGSS